MVDMISYPSKNELDKKNIDILMTSSDPIAYR